MRRYCIQSQCNDYASNMAIDVAGKKMLGRCLETNAADVIAMHMGTDDVWQYDKAVADIILYQRNSSMRYKHKIPGRVYSYIRNVPLQPLCLPQLSVVPTDCEGVSHGY
ncbi:cellulose-binding family ii [Pyrenophora seminiperda CCB06]|uniref:Cellulose-binding family ii n=1 Tax=Pyrenophora seminiperda CCB06 TaxID=1302712 RepID=A0A3M7M625_9PLEO|nr:cellulose-binding family ii [Pyrenophora seminiperda CCB06]